MLHPSVETAFMSFITDSEYEKAVFPGSRLSFLKLLEEPRYEDYEIEHDVPQNIFSFIGNGFHTLENDGSDISWYLGTVQGKHDLEEIRRQMDGRKGVQITPAG